MSNMNVSSRSQSMSSIPSTPKVAAPKPLSRTASTSSVPTHISKPEAFKSANATTAPAENKQVENQIQQASSQELRRNEQLMNTQVNNAIMSDLNAPAAPQTAAAPAPLSAEAASNLFAKSVDGFNKTMKFNATEIPIDSRGKIARGANALDTLLMRYNPHATPAAKKESEMFRAFAGIEHGKENTDFLDDSYKLTKLDPRSQAFDTHVDHLFNNYIQTNSDQMINVSSKIRGESAVNYQAYKDAQRNLADDKTSANEAKVYEARAKLMDSLAQNVGSINGMLKDTWFRYTAKSTFREDIHNNQSKSPFSGVKKRLTEQARESAANIAKKNDSYKKASVIQNHINLRLQSNRDHGRIYQEYQRTLKDPDWREREARVLQQKTAASGARPGSARFKLYNVFVAPWKSWG